MADPETPTALEAQELHEARQREDLDHDRGDCWCCCTDCGFDYTAVIGRG